MFRIVGLGAALASTASAYFHWHGCPKDYKPQATLDVDRYSGTWYEVAVDRQIPFEFFSKCVMAEYTNNGDGTVKVVNRAYGPRGSTELEGVGVVVNTGDASLSIRLGSGTPKPTDKANYTVMDTDYDSYAIFYSCNEFFGGRASFDYLWILAREPTLPYESMLARIETIKETIPHYNFY